MLKRNFGLPHVGLGSGTPEGGAPATSTVRLAGGRGTPVTGPVPGEPGLIRGSALCQERTYAPQQNLCLFDHLVGEHEQSWRNLEAECLGCLEIDNELIFGGCLHRKLTRLFASQNAINI